MKNWLIALVAYLGMFVMQPQEPQPLFGPEVTDSVDNKLETEKFFGELLAKHHDETMSKLADIEKRLAAIEAKSTVTKSPSKPVVQAPKTRRWVNTGTVCIGGTCYQTGHWVEE